MKEKSFSIPERLILIVSSKFHIPKPYILEHLQDPLNGDDFRFDSIDMVYFVLEIVKEFGITVTDSMVENCANWSIQDYAKELETIV